MWPQRPPSSTPRDPQEAAVDHVAGRTFTAAGLDTIFIRSTGRSKPVKHGSGAFASVTYAAVDADSKRAHDVLGAALRRDRDSEAGHAVQTGLADRSPANRQAAIDALQALSEE